MQIKVALIGFGNVGRAFAILLQEKHDYLLEHYGIDFIISGIATASHGMAIDPGGIDLQGAESIASSNGDLFPLSKTGRLKNIEDFTGALQADILIEISTVNYEDGEPALGHIRNGLEKGMHVITANKGPVVFAHHELMRLAASKGKQFFFESTVMDGAPVFSLFRESLPSAKIQSISGILNSTSNLILERMEAGQNMQEAIAYAQSIGIAEGDPSSDVEGWDATIKLCILVNVMMGANLKPQEIDRKGIENISLKMVREAQMQNQRWKLICRAKKSGNKIEAEVAPQLVSQDSPFYYIEGSTSILQIRSDVLGELSLTEKDPSPSTTAYGLLADAINASIG